mmetsp:Transcript_54754/g.162997  ORF Transcript_54754/g.162997 Transcript_54754/m.162997 type:complete len:234 (+) Transcript_54754:1245-1946(+)
MGALLVRLHLHESMIAEAAKHIVSVTEVLRLRQVVRWQFHPVHLSVFAVGFEAKTHLVPVPWQANHPRVAHHRWHVVELLRALMAGRLVAAAEGALEVLLGHHEVVRRRVLEGPAKDPIPEAIIHLVFVDVSDLVRQGVDLPAHYAAAHTLRRWSDHSVLLAKGVPWRVEDHVLVPVDPNLKGLPAVLAQLEDVAPDARGLVPHLHGLLPRVPAANDVVLRLGWKVVFRLAVD